MKRIAVVLLALVTFVDAGAIIIRHDVDDKKYIERAKRFLQICHFEMGEGTLIDQRWILTAGHVGSDLQTMLNRGKIPEVTCNQKTYHVDKIVIHSNFRNLNEGLANDIALVRIRETINDVTPALVDYQRSEINLPVTLVGRGDIGTGLTGPQKWDKITRAATNRIDSVEATWLTFDFDAPGTEGVTELEGISGPGDSGGPAFYEENDKIYVIGVSSFQRGQEKFGRGHYGVTEYYSRVSNYKIWIVDVLKDKDVSSGSLQPGKQGSPDDLQSYTGSFGFRKIILKDGTLNFQREDEPLIPMKKIGDDLFLWDDGNTKLQFIRNKDQKITGFEIRRRNGEVVNVEKSR